MSKEVYADLDHGELIYSEEVKTRMLQYLHSNTDHSREMDKLIEYFIDQTVTHMPVDIKRVYRTMEKFAESVGGEIMEEKFGIR